MRSGREANEDHDMAFPNRPGSSSASKRKISPTPPPASDMKTVGLIGGIAWHSTVDYYRDINKAVNDAYGDNTNPPQELKRFPSRSQITNHVCEQGWSFIAEWIGVSVSHILNVVCVLPRARYVIAFPYDNGDPPQSWWESIDMVDAWHPQTLLAYGMNGPELPIPHGAPVRLKMPRQLGYKNVKYLHRITVTETVKNIGKGVGGANVEDGYSWYAGI